MLQDKLNERDSNSLFSVFKGARLLRALYFTLIVCLPSISIYYVEGNRSFFIYSDTDESYYMLNAQNYGRAPLEKIVSTTFADHGNSTDLLFAVPHDLTEYAIGVWLSLFHLSAAQGALILDLFCCFFSYLLFSEVFFLITGNRLYGEIGSCILLGAPWIANYLFYFDIESVVHLPSQFKLVIHQPASWTCLPILRGPNTQLSYILLGVALIGLLKLLKEPNRKRFLTATFIGFAAGSCLYVYLFSWLTIAAFCIVANALLIFTKREKNFYFNNIIFLISFFITSLPGTLFLFLRPSWLVTDFTLSSTILARAIMLSPTSICIVGLLLFLLFYKKNRRYDLELASFIVVILSYNLLDNLQFFSTAFLQSMHFAALYTSPMLSALFAIFLLKWMSWTRTDLLWATCSTIFPFWFGFQQVCYAFGPIAYFDDLRELTSAIIKTVPAEEKLILDQPLIHLSVPTRLTLATGRKTLTVEPYNNFSNTLEEGLGREAWLRYLLDDNVYPEVTHALTDDQKLIDSYKSSDFFFNTKDLAKRLPVEKAIANLASQDLFKLSPSSYVIISNPKLIEKEITKDSVRLHPLWVSTNKNFQISIVEQIKP